MTIRWPIMALAIVASACTYGQATTTLSPPPPPPSPTTSAPAPEFDAQAFLADYFDELIEDHPALVVILSKPNFHDLDRAINALPELNGYSVEYLADFSRVRSLEAPGEDLIALGLWASYEDTDVQKWIDYLNDRFGVLAAGRGVQQFGFGSSSEDWEEVATLNLTSTGFWLAASEQRALVVTSGSAWLVRRGDAAEQVEHPPNWTLDNFRIIPAGNRFVAFADGGDPMVFDSDGWSSVDPRPTTDRLFGTVFINGRFFAVTAPGRNVGGEAGVVLELDLDSGEWTTLGGVPERINVGDVVGSIDSIIVSGTLQDGNNLMVGDKQPGVHVFDLETSTWETMPDAPLNGQAASVGSIGPYLLAWNYDMEWSLLPLGKDQWSAPRTVPLDQMECYPSTVSGTELAVGDFCGQLAIFTKGDWWAIPRPSGSIAVTNEGIWNAYESGRGWVDIFYFDFGAAGFPDAGSG